MAPLHLRIRIKPQSRTITINLLQALRPFSSSPRPFLYPDPKPYFNGENNDDTSSSPPRSLSSMFSGRRRSPQAPPRRIPDDPLPRPTSFQDLSVQELFKRNALNNSDKTEGAILPYETIGESIRKKQNLFGQRPNASSPSLIGDQENLPDSISGREMREKEGGGEGDAKELKTELFKRNALNNSAKTEGDILPTETIGENSIRNVKKQKAQELMPELVKTSAQLIFSLDALKPLLTKLRKLLDEELEFMRGLIKLKDMTLMEELDDERESMRFGTYSMFSDLKLSFSNLKSELRDYDAEMEVLRNKGLHGAFTKLRELLDDELEFRRGVIKLKHMTLREELDDERESMRFETYSMFRDYLKPSISELKSALRDYNAEREVLRNKGLHRALTKTTYSDNAERANSNVPDVGKPKPKCGERKAAAEEETTVVESDEGDELLEVKDRLAACNLHTSPDQTSMKTEDAVTEKAAPSKRSAEWKAEPTLTMPLDDNCMVVDDDGMYGEGYPDISEDTDREGFEMVEAPKAKGTKDAGAKRKPVNSKAKATTTPKEHITGIFIPVDNASPEKKVRKTRASLNKKSGSG